MKDAVRNFEAKMMVKGHQMVAPFKNRAAIDDNANKGIGGTVGLVIALILVALAVAITLIVVKFGQDSINDANSFFDQLWQKKTGINQPVKP